jgi:hypothetical protein
LPCKNHHEGTEKAARIGEKIAGLVKANNKIKNILFCDLFFCVIILKISRFMAKRIVLAQ